MGMTMSQKILAAHAGLREVQAGQLIEARLDIVHANDITGPISISEFEKAGAKSVYDPEKVVLIMDHFVPNKDIKSAEQCITCRNFAKEQNLLHFYDVGEMGIEHCFIPEQGIVVAGDCTIGADSHTCTYGALGAFSTGVGSTDLTYGMITGKTWFRVPGAIRFNLTGEPSRFVGGKDLILHIIGLIGVEGARYQSMEFTGSGVEHLTMDDRFTVANMAIEAGAKNGIFPVDSQTETYMKTHYKRPWTVYQADADAVYEREITVDLSALRPTVSFPHIPENTRTIDETGDVPIDQVVIGSCTNGRISDLRIAADILRGRKVAKGLRVIVIPGTQQVYLDALREGLIEDFIRAGAVVSTPTCGPCLGGYMGVLGKGERALSTTNRNFVGRMGDKHSEVYLASPAVAAASALSGRISNPETI